LARYMPTPPEETLAHTCATSAPLPNGMEPANVACPSSDRLGSVVGVVHVNAYVAGSGICAPTATTAAAAHVIACAQPPCKRGWMAA